MSRLAHVFGAVLLMTGGCVGNVMEAEQRLGSGFPSDSGQYQPNDGTIWFPDGGIGAAATPGGLASGGFPGMVTPGGGGTAGAPDAGAPDAIGQLPANPNNPCGNGGEPLAPDMRILELALYQAVKIPLFKDGGWVTTRNASVVQGKKTLLRTFVEPLTGYRARPLRAVLTLDNDGQKTELSSEKAVTSASTDEATASTFDFDVEGALIGPNTQLSVAILEPTCPAQLSAGFGARVPAAGLQTLGAVRIGKLRIVVVPVSVNGRAPDTSDMQLSKIRDELLAYYPVSEVEVTAHAPLTWPNALSSGGAGWSELLNQIGRERQRDAVARDVYYFGLVAPTASFGEYCRTGCVLGMAPQTTFVSPPDQIGLGVGFVNANTYSTVVHEIGHAHGRGHAPCVPPGGSIQSPDPRYPYPGGGIGSWGWDSRSNQLKSPARFTDVMGYCDPHWISDFNYEALATRSRSVNTSANIFTNKAAQTTWQRVILFADGRARWGGVSTSETPTDLTSVRVLDAQGQALGEVSVARVPLSHSADSFLYVPTPEAGWATLELGDRNLVLGEIEPAG